MEKIESYEQWKERFGEFHIAEVFFRHNGAVTCDMERCEAKIDGIAQKSVAGRVVARFVEEKMRETLAQRERERMREEKEDIS